MKTYSFLLLIFQFLLIQSIFTQGESFYMHIIHQYLGGEKEVKVQNGRIDILNDEYAIEVDFAKKWKEAIGQSIWYALNTNKKAGIVLIRKGDYDTYHFQLYTALEYAGLSDKIKVWLYPDDFPNCKSLEEDFQGKLWLNTSRNTRHNSKCASFANTKRGRFCTASEGRACGSCKG